VSSLAMSASMQPIVYRRRKARRVRNFGIPGLGRIAFSRDPGEAALFAERFLRTRLEAIITNPYGELVEHIDLGSGKVTNLGVLALANDFQWAQVSGSPVNTLGACKFHAWGTGATAAAVTDFELQTPAAPTGATENAVEGVNSLVFENKGKNQTIKSQATIKAGGVLAITEWGLHSVAAIRPAEKTGGAGAPTSTTFFPEAASLTESTAVVRGAENSVIWIAESAGASHALVGLIQKNKTGEVTVPGWVKSATEETGELPKEKSKYRIIPTLFDHRVFSALNLESGNEVTFPWTLEIVAGG
jgi:hypothetical protein